MDHAAQPPEPPELPDDLDAREIEALGEDDAYVEIELTDLSLVDGQAAGVTFETVSS
jgi:hypothetical protein